MQDSLSNLADNLSEINNKESENNVRSMMTLLSMPINKKSQIDRKEPKNNSIDIVRSMMTLLSMPINKKSQIDRKISQIDKKEPEINL